MFFQRAYIFIFFLIGFFRVGAQEFTGLVSRMVDKSTKPVYQAVVDVWQGEDSVMQLKSYFDGSFKIPLEKNASYKVRVGYTGYKDTVFTFETDKKANPTVKQIKILLIKDGMRLMGVIRSTEEKFPIENATIVIKDVSTRREDRFTTGIDGAYNIKLQYETNYRVSIDKRSPGVMNKYRDTTFYVSTIGFNLPLDYKLDIYLEPDLYPNTKPREGYDSNRKPLNKTVRDVHAILGDSVSKYQITPKQPFAEDNEKLKDAQKTIGELQEELEKTQKKLEDVKQRKEKSEPEKSLSEKKKGVKKQKEAIEVQIIEDKPAPATNTESSKSASEGINKLKVVQDTIHKNINPVTDSVKGKFIGVLTPETTKPVETRIVVSATAKDSVLEVNQMKSGTVAKTVKTDLQKPVSSKVAVQPIAAKPETSKSDEKDTKPYLSKTQEELIAAAEAFSKQKRVQDSISKVKALQQKIQSDTIGHK